MSHENRFAIDNLSVELSKITDDPKTAKEMTGLIVSIAEKDKRTSFSALADSAKKYLCANLSADSLLRYLRSWEQLARKGGKFSAVDTLNAMEKVA